ncbi:MAG: transposase [Pseudanabaena sp.]
MPIANILKQGKITISLKNGCNWADLPKDLPPYSTVYWHYKQWRASGVLREIMTALHEQVREQYENILTNWCLTVRMNWLNTI